MIRNSNEDGNAILNIALYPDGERQPPICARICWSEQETIHGLLSTGNIGIDKMRGRYDGTFFLLLYDANLTAPYPSVMIWKYIRTEEDLVFVDIEQDEWQDLIVIDAKILQS